ncbi:calcium-binding protein PBP1-like [Typha angustifolia]|uniref:calcium-binding protein PBP1-like n=1 Tax=Typha angustifolia TaxID=59011 RepID=UPI003C2B8931
METPSKNLFSSSAPSSTPLASPHPSPTQPIQEIAPTGIAEDLLLGFEDFLPSMAEKLGAEGLVEELCKGFQLLMDSRTGLITLESLKRNAARLGLEGLGNDELLGMITEGDLDGDGALDQMEFCVLMVRLSPELMQGSQKMFEEVLWM